MAKQSIAKALRTPRNGKKPVSATAVSKSAQVGESLKEVPTLVLTEDLVDCARIAEESLNEASIQLDTVSRLVGMAADAEEQADRDALIDGAMMVLEAVRTSVDDGCSEVPGLWCGVTTVSRAISKAADRKVARANGGAAESEAAHG